MRAEGNEVSIAQLCRWFGVPRSTFYHRGTPERRQSVIRLAELAGYASLAAPFRPPLAAE